MRGLLSTVVLVACGVCWTTGVASAQPCEPSWSDAFGAGAPLGRIRAQVVMPGSEGDILYAGDTAGVWQWDGAAWTQIGQAGGGSGSLDDHGVHALAIYDDGSGPALYAGGNFLVMSGATARNIARWDGQAWHPLATGLWQQNQVGGPAAIVRALMAYDPGAGPQLVAAGSFNRADMTAVNQIASWNGSTWSALGTGITGGSNPPAAVYALEVYTPPGGSAGLIATGVFSTAGGAQARGVARWDGAGWSALGTGLLFPNDVGRALEVFDDGTGAKLYVGGEISGAGGVQSPGVVRWDGSAWSRLPSASPSDHGTSGGVFALHATPERLYLGGRFTFAGTIFVGALASYDGFEWTPLGEGLPPTTNDLWHQAYSIVSPDDGSGPAVYVGGRFTKAGDVSVNNIARWDGQSWHAVGEEARGLRGFGTIRSINTGAFRGVYLLGYDSLGATLVNKGLLRWDGQSWTGLRLPAAPPASRWSAQSIAAFDDGSGEALYSGWTHGPQGYETGVVSVWDGEAWTTLPGEFGNAGAPVTLNDLIVYDDGSGPALYVGGTFQSVGGVACANIARWTGTQWEPLGTGLTGTNPIGEGPGVIRLLVVDDVLHVAGAFSAAGGVAASGVARWDGAWSAVGPTTISQLRDAAVLDDGEDQSLLLGFTIFPNPVRQVTDAGWGVYGTVPPVMPMAVGAFDDGRGPAGYVSGFGTAGSPLLFRWSGDTWEPAAGGLNNAAQAMTTFDDDGDGPLPASLWVIGGFTRAGGAEGVSSMGIAKLTGCAPACAADWNQDASVNSGDISAFLTAWLDSVQNGNLIADFNADMAVNSGDISAFLTAWLNAVSGGC